MKWNNIIIWFCLLVGCQMAFGQLSLERQLIGSTGNDSQSGTISLSSSLGEVAVSFSSSGTISLSEGFQQADEMAVGLEGESFEFSYDIFPNPTSGKLYVHITSDQPLLMKVEIYDLHGKSCGIQSPEQWVQGRQSLQLDLEELSTATYLLAFISGGKIFRVVRIVKT